MEEAVESNQLAAAEFSLSQSLDDYAEAKNKQFLLLVVVTAIRCLSVTYYIDNFKYFSLSIVNDDAFISALYVWGSVFSIAGRVVSGFMWERLGFVSCYTLCLFFAIAMDSALLVFSSMGLAVYVVLTFFMRAFYSINSLFNSMTLFGLYSPEKAAKLTKFYELNGFVNLGFAVLANAYLAREKSYGRLIVCFVVVDAVGLYTFWSWFGTSEERSRNCPHPEEILMS